MGLLRRMNTCVKVDTLSAHDGNRLPAGACDGGCLAKERSKPAFPDGQIPIAISKQVVV
jgi:hypothetical protein